MLRVFKKPEKTKIFINNILFEIEKLGIQSIGIVFIISIFMGAVITLQTAYNIEVSFVPLYLIGLTARDSMFLEFSSTIVGLILAGKAGANIASEIGTMRMREQIDALEIMGINSANHLILPKIIAAMFSFPLLTIFSMFIGIGGGYVATLLTNAVPPGEYLYGIHYYFIPFYITYSLIKAVIFAFIITTVPAYHGYYVEGGALEVGRASTRAVVFSSILILLFNVILTQLLLA
jgi:phospholipid/cholesterol/gamma-HCH transport system permease protein